MYVNMYFMYILYIRIRSIKMLFHLFLSEYNVRKVRHEHDYITESENSSHRNVFRITEN